MKTVLFTDLDDTLFSTARKNTIDTRFVLGSTLQDGSSSGWQSPTQQAFMSLWQTSLNALVIPVTARNHDAFSRVTLKFTPQVATLPTFAIINHGGVILADGRPLPEWHTQQLIHSGESLLWLETQRDKLADLAKDMKMDIRLKMNSDHDLNLYVLLKSNDNDDIAVTQLAQRYTEKYADPAQGYVHCNSNNLAILPNWLSKTSAVSFLQQHLSQYFSEFLSIGCGDSLSDLGFMQACDFWIAPKVSQITQQIGQSTIPTFTKTSKNAQGDSAGSSNNSLFHGSYHPNEVTFLLKPLTHVDNLPLMEKERAIQTGRRHYSEMLTPEKLPSDDYLQLFHQALAANGPRMAQDCITLSNVIAQQFEQPVLISLARAGTPVGVILKHLLSAKIGRDVSHYSVSIIRDRGIDANALNFIRQQHGGDGSNWVFIDGWTGKGVITQELQQAIEDYNRQYQMRALPNLYVLSDLAGVAWQSASFDDYLIPSAILNSTVSGLISRSVLNQQIGVTDFHGCLYYKDFEKTDQSRDFVAKLLQLAEQQTQVPNAPNLLEKQAQCDKMSEFILALSDEFNISDWNLIKPGLGEATRVLLRRIPERLLLRDLTDVNIQHLRVLAQEKNVMVSHRPDLPFSAVSLIRSAQ